MLEPTLISERQFLVPLCVGLVIGAAIGALIAAYILAVREPGRRW